MSTIGVVGGRGSTGRVVVAELARTADLEVLIGGRELAADRDLDEFCGRCSIVINCAGPVMRLRDRIAQAAFRRRCHYIDLAGLGIVKEAMLPHQAEIERLGLSYVISAGWMPGLTELVPLYAYARAKSQGPLSVFYSDSGEWSDNALRDAAWYLHHTGLPKPGYFRKGEWLPIKMSQAAQKVDLGEPIGLRQFSPVFLPEMAGLALQLFGSEVFSYSYLPNMWNAFAATCIAGLPFSEGRGIRLMRGIFRRNRLAVGGFIVAKAGGFTARITFPHGRDYWINGIVPATVARLIARGRGVIPGVRFLAEAVDPIVFMNELKKAGVECSDQFADGRST